VLRDRQLGAPVAASLDIGLKLGVAVDLGAVILLVGVEGRGVGRDVDGVGPVEVGGAKPNVLAPTSEHLLRQSEYLPYHLAHLDAACLVQQQHPECASLLCFQLRPRLCSAQEIRGLGSCASLVRRLRKMICARREQHLADAADGRRYDQWRDSRSQVRHGLWMGADLTAQETQGKFKMSSSSSSSSEHLWGGSLCSTRLSTRPGCKVVSMYVGQIAHKMQGHQSLKATLVYYMNAYA
jgi:hypothetical protein